MAANQIPIVPSADRPHAQALLQLRAQYVSYRQQQANLVQQGVAMLGKIAAMKDGSDYTRIEQQLGLQAGQGQTVFDQLNSVVGNFRDNDSHAAVNAAIDQFNNWIG
jgi:hypothetical protein